MSGRRQALAPNRSVADYYDGVAEHWDDAYGSGRQNERFARQVRAQLLAALSSAGAISRALEVGAGTGPYLELTAPLFEHLTATDLSSGMLGVMKRRIADLGLTNVTVMQADACELSGISDNSMDLVYSVGVLETLPDLDRAFTAMHRVLKPHGVVAGITSNGSCPWYAVRRWLEGDERHGRTGQLATATLLDCVFRRIGFEGSSIDYWGALPPGVQSAPLIAILGAIEALAAPTPLARLFGVMSFRARKLCATS